MTEKKWLIRTKNKQILGPATKEKIIDLIEKGSLTDADEISSGNGHWFWIKEKDLLDKYVYGDSVQSFNPMNEATNVLALNGGSVSLPNLDEYKNLEGDPLFKGEELDILPYSDEEEGGNDLEEGDALDDDHTKVDLNLSDLIVEDGSTDVLLEDSLESEDIVIEEENVLDHSEEYKSKNNSESLEDEGGKVSEQEGPSSFEETIYLESSKIGAKKKLASKEKVDSLKISHFEESLKEKKNKIEEGLGHKKESLEKPDESEEREEYKEKYKEEHEEEYEEEYEEAPLPQENPLWQKIKRFFQFILLLSLLFAALAFYYYRNVLNRSFPSMGITSVQAQEISSFPKKKVLLKLKISKILL